MMVCSFSQMKNNTQHKIQIQRNHSTEADFFLSLSLVFVQIEKQ